MAPLLTTFLLRGRPLLPGTRAPSISLTAANGDWFQSRDCIGLKYIIAVFYRTAGKEDPQDQLRAFEERRIQFEDLDAVLVGINQDRPDAQRKLAKRLGIVFPLLYDILAWTARSVQQSGRRPYVRNGAVLIDKEGIVVLHSHQDNMADALLSALREREGLESPQDEETVEQRIVHIDWPQAQAMLAASNTTLLDVRTRGEFLSLHVPQAMHLPVDDISTRHLEVNPDHSILCVCQTGGRSEAAASFLISLGFHQVYNIRGGMSAWPGAQQASESDS